MEGMKTKPLDQCCHTVGARTGPRLDLHGLGPVTRSIGLSEHFWVGDRYVTYHFPFFPPPPIATSPNNPTATPRQDAEGQSVGIKVCPLLLLFLFLTLELQVIRAGSFRTNRKGFSLLVVFRWPFRTDGKGKPFSSSALGHFKGRRHG